MYAVMRFGKTFTSLMCAKRMDAKSVLVVSAKADVMGEWKQTVESAGNFESFVFLDAEALLANADAIADARAADQCPVVFLTLQDLMGPKVKEKHEEVFSDEIDLLIIDETHFGARAEEYGRVLREADQAAEDKSTAVRLADDLVAVEDADIQLKQLSAKVRLHLSGSPYRILMGSEFAAEDVIATVQFADIVHEQDAWDRKHPDEDEWDNPYFGFPEMVRFAFHPNQSSRDKLEALKQSGVRYAFAALLQPRSIERDAANELHKKFIHEAEIRDLLRVIDGSEQDENVLGFLDHDRIKQGEMCQHLVMVLPYCASCDAMEALIQQETGGFKNLQDYEIINISGLDGKTKYPRPLAVKDAIAKAAKEGRKTLTLTVNRMLTGSTVEQWDTMVFLKDTSSPQEYDQATFRLQSPHLRSLKDKVAGQVIRENLKPQTLLVDFDPARLFMMQEQRSLMSSAVADDDAGDLEARLQEDLRISPVVTVNTNKLARVEPADILEAISQYNCSRSVADEARDVPVDRGLFDDPDILRIIERQAEIGARAGLTLNSNDGEEQDLDVDDPEPWEDSDRDRAPAPEPPPPPGGDDLESLDKRLQTYYQRILFFAMLSPDQVRSLDDVLEAIEHGVNARIATNLGLALGDLRLIRGAFDRFKLNRLDYKIQNISLLVRDPSLTPIERASRALNKVDRLSDSEVRTQPWVCQELVGTIPADELRALVERGEAILDVASKSGEFTHALYDRLVGELGLDPQMVRSALYAIPTSTVAYEFTRRFFEFLDLDADHVARGITSYDVAAEPNATDVDANLLRFAFSQGDDAPKFGAVVGNPPYHETDGGAQASARPIYQRFIAAAGALHPEFMCFVIPTRWYRGGRAELDSFRAKMLADPHIRELHDFPNPEKVFPNTNNRGGVCFFLRDANYDATEAGGTRVVTRGQEAIEAETIRPLNTLGLGSFLRDSKGVGIVQKVITADGFASFEDQVSGRKPFGLEGGIVRSSQFHAVADGLGDPVRCFGRRQAIGYVERELVQAHTEWIDDWKVLAPYANNIGTELSDDNLNAFVVEPGSVCSETFIAMGVGLNLTEQSATNLVVYLRSTFARFLLAMAKISQHATRETYCFVPTVDVSDGSDIDWRASSEAVDDQLFDAYELTAEQRDHIRASIKPM
jgi:hypothetical protein